MLKQLWRLFVKVNLVSFIFLLDPLVIIQNHYFEPKTEARANELPQSTLLELQQIHESAFPATKIPETYHRLSQEYSPEEYQAYHTVLKGWSDRIKLNSVIWFNELLGKNALTASQRELYLQSMAALPVWVCEKSCSICENASLYLDGSVCTKHKAAANAQGSIVFIDGKIIQNYKKLSPKIQNEWVEAVLSVQAEMMLALYYKRNVTSQDKKKIVSAKKELNLATQKILEFKQTKTKYSREQLKYLLASEHLQDVTSLKKNCRQDYLKRLVNAQKSCRLKIDSTKLSQISTQLKIAKCDAACSQLVKAKPGQISPKAVYFGEDPWMLTLGSGESCDNQGHALYARAWIVDLLNQTSLSKLTKNEIECIKKLIPETSGVTQNVGSGSTQKPTEEHPEIEILE
jgi:hypothetical protein